MDKMELEAFREDLRQRVDPTMDRSRMKEFADYVLSNDQVREDYYQIFINDMYDGFLEDEG
jgi:hypothetical protein|tara:strand:- start:643 stop:825 length:183 start_codon:yes stop_codon:yes gene_type:complete